MARQKIIRMLPSLLLLSLTVIYLVTGYRTLDEESRHVPLLTAYVTIFLILLDLVAVWRGKQHAEPDEIDSPLKDEIRAVLSLLGLVVAVYFLGFYIGGGLYLMASLIWVGKQGFRFSIITTVITFICIYLLFEKTLAFELFRGVLFAEY